MLSVIQVLSGEFRVQLEVVPFNIFLWGGDEAVVASISILLELLGDGGHLHELAGEPSIALLGEVLVQVLALVHIPRAEELLGDGGGQRWGQESGKNTQQHKGIHRGWNEVKKLSPTTFIEGWGQGL